MVIFNVIKLGLTSLIGETRNSTHHFSSKKIGGRLNVYFESRLKLDIFSRNSIYSERVNFSASFYNKKLTFDVFSEMIDFVRGA